MKINILGTEYTIKNVKISECNILKENHWSGLCNSVTHEILVGIPTEEEFFGKLTEQEQTLVVKEILRHEIIHAFMNESGLQDNWQHAQQFGHDETTVDWFALQSPKIFNVFKELELL